MSKRKRPSTNVATRKHHNTSEGHVFVDLMANCDICHKDRKGIIHCHNYSRWYKKNPETKKWEYNGPQNTHTCIKCASQCKNCDHYMCSDVDCSAQCNGCDAELCSKCKYQCPSCRLLYCNECTQMDTCDISKCCICGKFPSHPTASLYVRPQLESCGTCSKPICAGPGQRCSTDCADRCGRFCKKCGHSCYGC